MALAGCGDDGMTSGDAAMDAGGDGGDGGSECVGAADGTSCGEGLICVGGECTAGRCGDGILDEASGEACDDGNDTPSDGCEPGSCAFTCATPEECDDGFACNGAETCNVGLHRCQAGTPMAGAMCTRMDGTMGVCTASMLCQPPGCGNGVMDAGEECDDSANGDDTDGCRDDCTYTCEEDTECADEDACNGAEVCVVSTHTCMNPGPPDCDDGDPCTNDACEAEMGCVNPLDDADLDGYSAADTCTTAGLSGGDCDDTNSSVYPGASELCDTIDNDCNGVVDDMTVSVTCLRDSDGDGWGNASMSMDACTCPAGYIPPRADAEVDCHDGYSSVNPGQTSYFPTRYCGVIGRLCPTGFDYDCDGVESQRWTTSAGSSCTLITIFGTAACLGSGWTGSTPACGVSGEYQSCTLLTLPGIGTTCRLRTMSQTQECR